MTIHRDLDAIDTDIQQSMSRILQNWFMSEAYRYENDFFDYDEDDDWTATVVDTDADSGATRTILDERGGVLSLLTDDNALDSINLQKQGETFYLLAGYPMYFEARFRVDCTAIANPTVLVGLCVTDTTLIAGLSDGVYFICDNGDANLDFVTEDASTETKTDTGVDLVDATWVRVGFYWDGSGNVTPYVNGTAGTVSTTNLPDDTEMCISFSMLNGEAAANKLEIDYVKCVQKR